MSTSATENFINKARKIHGVSRYNYDKVVYVNSHTKVTITCPVHGDFEVTPANHLHNKRGCPKCSYENLSKKKKLNQDSVYSRMIAAHGNKYDYSKFVYLGMLNKATVICPIHGEFQITPAKHIHMHQGCPKCSGQSMDTAEFIRRAKLVHGSKYDYSKVVYKGANIPIKIVCPIHGVFNTLPSTHISNKSGCPLCGHHVLSVAQFIDKAKSIHGNKYNYSKVLFKQHSDKVTIDCPLHGEFTQTVSNHLKSEIACPSCRLEARMNSGLFIEKANIVHGNRYKYDNVEYVNSNKPVSITCPVHGDFMQSPHNHMAGHGCPRCKTITSTGERGIIDFLKSLGFNPRCHNRSVLDGRELDIYIPEKKLAIEYDGLYWHSSNFKENTYHVNKTDACLKKGVTLIHIFEDEWMAKQNIVKSRLRHILGKQCLHIAARKCAVSRIEYYTAEKFCNKYHIQGSCPSSINLGLFYRGRIIAVMTFGKPRFSKNHSWELLRYCSLGSVSVVGGAGKLLSYFRKHYQGSIITYADRRWSNGNLYRKLGMTELKKSRPSYYYIKNGVRYNRVMFQKHKLSKLLPVYDNKSSESSNMRNNGYYRLYDCGCYRFELL